MKRRPISLPCLSSTVSMFRAMLELKEEHTITLDCVILEKGVSWADLESVSKEHP